MTPLQIICAIDREARELVMHRYTFIKIIEALGGWIALADSLGIWNDALDTIEEAYSEVSK